MKIHLGRRDNNALIEKKTRCLLPTRTEQSPSTPTRPGRKLHARRPNRCLLQSNTLVSRLVRRLVPHVKPGLSELIVAGRLLRSQANPGHTLNTNSQRTSCKCPTITCSRHC